MSQGRFWKKFRSCGFFGFEHLLFCQKSYFCCKLQALYGKIMLVKKYVFSYIEGKWFFLHKHITLFTNKIFNKSAYSFRSISVSSLCLFSNIFFLESFSYRSQLKGPLTKTTRPHSLTVIPIFTNKTNLEIFCNYLRLVIVCELFFLCKIFL